MASYSRFSDDGYKNWLKTTMSLQLLKSSLNGFVENETETYHRSLRKKLGDATCRSQCDARNWKINSKEKVPAVCDTCVPWRNEILENHTFKGGKIYWNNCKPCMWSTDKWEVAKVYMPDGNKHHIKIDQFDISAVLNLMSYCKHFKQFVKAQFITQVISVRNKMMHSADMKVSKEDMETHLSKIFELVRHLQLHTPSMKETEQEIKQLQKTELSIIVNSQYPVYQGSIINNLLTAQKLHDLEQQVLKEKIESLAQCLKEHKSTLKNEEILAMKEFLDQNKDLLKQLGPQVEKLNVIEEKVGEHEKQLGTLTEKVDKLHTKTSELVFSVVPVRYKNHLLEEVVKKNWPAPLFSEKRSSHGYIGVVELRGKTFEGVQIHPNTKAAHQEVSKLALDWLETQPSSGETGEGGMSTDQPQGMANTAVLGTRFFSSVTLELKNEISSPEGHCGKEEAMESAYKELASKFAIDVSPVGTSYKKILLQDFLLYGFPKPEECFYTDVQDKVSCKLKLSGQFTFHGQEGSSKKKQAEQQAAKAALLRLSGVLGCTLPSGENCKGMLKEEMEARGLPPPIYEDITGMQAGLQDEPSLPVSIDSSEMLKNEENEAGGKLMVPETPSMSQAHGEALKVVSPAVHQPEIQDAQSSHIDFTEVGQGSTVGRTTTSVPKQQEEHSVSSGNNQFYATVKVPVKRELDGPKARTTEEATEEAYRILAGALALIHPQTAPPTGSIKKLVLDFFSQTNCEPPVEHQVTEGGTFSGKLGICGVFTFRNQEGASKKQQAEQGAAKEALTRLAGLLGWDFAGMNGNYKGKLQELLVKQGEKVPTYFSVPGPGDAETSSKPPDNSSPGVTGCHVVFLRDAEAETLPHTDHNPQNPQKTAKIEVPAIEAMLQIFGLQNSSQSLQISSEKRFVFQVKISLESFTFKNEDSHTSKNDARRNTYLKFGQALGICEPDTEENRCTGLVKDHFRRHSFDLPSEDFVNKANMFSCSLTVKSCSISYEAEGPSEEAARQEVSKQAFCHLAPLFGYECAVSTSRDEEVEGRLCLMLTQASQQEPEYQHTGTLYKGMVQLRVSDLTLESRDTCKRTARISLCTRILGLLGEDVSGKNSNASARNMVDDWFKKRKISPPVFQDITDGTTATFSAPLTFCHPDWQDSWENAEKKLTELLKTRFSNIPEKTN